MVTTRVLHIRKAAGNALNRALAPFADSHGLSFEKHKFRLQDIAEDERGIVVIREPIGRFVSGFNSRFRQGLPLKLNPWTEKEASVFATFKTPNALAEALSSDDAARRKAADFAMRAVSHLRFPLRYWMEGWEAFGQERLLIADTATLDRDFQRIVEMLGLPSVAALPSDPVAAHKTPEGLAQDLTPLALTNLEVRLADDLSLYKVISEGRWGTPVS